MEAAQRPEDEAVLQQRLACLQQQQARDGELQQLLNRKAGCIFQKVEVTARSLADQAERDKAALSRAVAAREFDLSRCRVDLLRWRQRSALLKVQLSSAEEDVRRYARIGAILLRQSELEQGARAATQAAAAGAVAAAAERGATQAAAWRGELQSAQAGLEERQNRLAALQQELAASSRNEAELGQQLEAVAAQRTELERSITAAGDRAAVLQQEVGQLKADNAQLERWHANAEAAAQKRLAEAEKLQLRADRLQEEVASKGAEIESLQKRLGAEEKLVAELRQELQDKCAQVVKLEGEAATRTVSAFVSQLESPLMLNPSKDAAGPSPLQPAAGEASAAAAPVAVAQRPTLPQRQAAAKSHPAGAPAAAAKKKPAAKEQGQRKRKSQQVEKEVLEEAEAPTEAEQPEAEAAAPAGRPRRERSKAQPYWLGPQQADAEGQAGEQPQAAEPAQPAPAASAAAELPPAAKDGAAGQQGPEEGKARKRSRRKAPPQPEPQPESQPEPVAQQEPEEPAQEEAPLEEEEAPAEAPVAEAKAQKGKGRKGPLKRPQGEIKTNLTSVWGGGTPVPAPSDAENEGPKCAKPPRKSNLAPKNAAGLPQPEAAGSSQQHHAPPAGNENAGGQQQGPYRGSQGSAAPGLPQRQQLEVNSRVQERPLGVLNQRTLAAAANMLNRPALPLKSSIQKAIAARGEQSQQQQQQKRKLLPVTTNYASAALPLDALFGGSFKAPKLAK